MEKTPLDVVKIIEDINTLHEKRIVNLKSLVNSQEKIVTLQNEIIEASEQLLKSSFRRGFLVGSIIAGIILTIGRIILTTP